MVPRAGGAFCHSGFEALAACLAFAKPAAAIASPACGFSVISAKCSISLQFLARFCWHARYRQAFAVPCQRVCSSARAPAQAKSQRLRRQKCQRAVRAQQRKAAAARLCRQRSRTLPCHFAPSRMFYGMLPVPRALATRNASLDAR